MMTKARRRTTYGLLACALTLSACGGGEVSIETGASAAAGRWDLAKVADSCRDSATDVQPGIVEIATELRDANARVTIDVPCIIHLVGGADVTLANVQLTTQTLNVHDRDTGSEPNKVIVARSTITASGDGSGILIELNDAEDVLETAASKITAPAGILVHVADQRDDSGGGSIRLVRSTLLSEGVGTSGIQVLSSEQSGSIRLVETVLDTPGSLTVLAAECQSVRAGQRLDCSAEQVGRGLGD